MPFPYLTLSLSQTVRYLTEPKKSFALKRSWSANFLITIFHLHLRSSTCSSWSLGSSTTSTQSSTPFCTQFSQSASGEVSQTYLESVGFIRWHKILAKSGLEWEFRRSSPKLCPGAPRRKAALTRSSRSLTWWSFLKHFF